MGLFELLYYLGYRLKRSSDLRKQKRLPAKVVSIGNITAGGTGKTPLTIALADEAVRRGLAPVVLTRGYKGKIKGPAVITPDMTAKEAGDEPLLLAEKLPGVPIVKDKNRYRGGMTVFESKGSGGFAPAVGSMAPEEKGMGAEPPLLFILDDGFQHRRLYRDLDILLINARNPFDTGKLLPIGLLREPVREIGRADIIVITKGTESDDAGLIDMIRRHNRHARMFSANYGISHIGDSAGGSYPASWLNGKDVYAFCGIGAPESFREGLERAGANVRGFRAYGDHYRFKKGNIGGISNAARKCGASWIITTEKDIMRLRALDLPENLFSLAVELLVEEGFYEEVFEGIR